MFLWTSLHFLFAVSPQSRQLINPWNERRGTTPVVRPTHRGSSNCLLLLNRQRQSPRRYENTIHVEHICKDTAPKGTTMACNEPQGNDIITPWASTVAKFKTIKHREFARFDGSRTERQVNAFIMLCPVTHPSPYHGVCAPLKARRELRHGMFACLQDGFWHPNWLTCSQSDCKYTNFFINAMLMRNIFWKIVVCNEEKSVNKSILDEPDGRSQPSPTA